MLQPMHKIILQTYCDRHRKLLAFVENMTDAQLQWLPQTYGNSIAFNLWHLARWADEMQVIVPGMTTELKRRLGERTQIWESEGLAAKWGFKQSQHGFAETGMEMSDLEARRLNFPAKAEMLDYARKAFAAIEEAVSAIDEEQFNAPEQLQPLTEGIWGEGTVGEAIFSHIVHDSRHVGMMECLYGLQTGSGTATL